MTLSLEVVIILILAAVALVLFVAILCLVRYLKRSAVTQPGLARIQYPATGHVERHGGDRSDLTERPGGGSTRRHDGRIGSGYDDHDGAPLLEVDHTSPIRNSRQRLTAKSTAQTMLAVSHLTPEPPIQRHNMGYHTVSSPLGDDHDMWDLGEGSLVQSSVQRSTGVTAYQLAALDGGDGGQLPGAVHLTTMAATKRSPLQRQNRESLPQSITVMPSHADLLMFALKNQLSSLKRPNELHLIVTHSEPPHVLEPPRIVTFPVVPGFVGLGLTMMGSSPVRIAAVDPGSPAALGGALLGDCIIEVDGNPCLRMQHHQVVEIMSAQVAQWQHANAHLADDAHVDVEDTAVDLQDTAADDIVISFGQNSPVVAPLVHRNPNLTAQQQQSAFEMQQSAATLMTQGHLSQAEALLKQAKQLLTQTEAETDRLSPSQPAPRRHSERIHQRPRQIDLSRPHSAEHGLTSDTDPVQDGTYSRSPATTGSTTHPIQHNGQSKVALLRPKVPKRNTSRTPADEGPSKHRIAIHAMPLALVAEKKMTKHKHGTTKHGEGGRERQVADLRKGPMHRGGSLRLRPPSSSDAFDGTGGHEGQGGGHGEGNAQRARQDQVGTKGSDEEALGNTASLFVKRRHPDALQRSRRMQKPVPVAQPNTSTHPSPPRGMNHGTELTTQFLTLTSSSSPQQSRSKPARTVPVIQVLGTPASRIAGVVFSPIRPARLSKRAKTQVVKRRKTSSHLMTRNGASTSPDFDVVNAVPIGSSAQPRGVRAQLGHTASCFMPVRTVPSSSTPFGFVASEDGVARPFSTASSDVSVDPNDFV
eukprot:m.29535 g.29535  ORF g.29535 m.29535 type:complete len:813 (+) comp9175_c0_seq3:303-2741(+)